MLKGRTLGRAIVLQSLFELDNENAWDKNKSHEVLKRNFDEFARDKKLLSYCKELIDTILAKRKELDEIITKAAPQWPLDRIALVDRNILRLGLAELIFADHSQVPYKVAINEAIELAKEFGSDKSHKFVNGVLGSVYKDMGEPGKSETTKIDNEEEVISAIPYAKEGDEIYLALVHDIFGFWALVKGKKFENESDEDALKRKVKEEIGLEIKEINDKLGNTSYTAKNKEGKKVRRNVTYYLTEVPFEDLKLKNEGGLDDARWFRLVDIRDLKFYDDVLDIITNAINILIQK